MQLYRFARVRQPVVFLGIKGGPRTIPPSAPPGSRWWIGMPTTTREALERIAESREEIAALPDGDFKAGLAAALDELEQRHRGEPEQTALEIAAG